MVRKPGRVFPIVGLLYGDEGILPQVESAICCILGPVASSSEELDFRFSSYYEKEMGAPLFRSWLFFDRPCDPGSLARLKIETNRIEAGFESEKGRRVNVDPGFLSPMNLVLASTKHAAHRIYIGDGIFAEIELIYEKGTYSPLRWTYPDYRTSELITFLNRARGKILTACSLPASGSHENKKVNRV